MFSLLASLKNGFETLLFPPICIACRREGFYTCNDCEREWAGVPTTIADEPIQLLSVVRYGNNSSHVVLAAKEEGNKAAGKLLSLAISSAASWKLRSDIAHITLVPMPSSKKNIRRRGERFLLPILERVIIDLERNKKLPKFQIRELLIQNPRIREQSGLSLRERQANMSQALRIDEKALRHWKETPLILVDDVITTASTMMSAYSVLNERNLTILAGISACATNARMPIR